jgi:hypothetical protein
VKVNQKMAGCIVSKGLPHNKRFSRFVDKRIHQWVIKAHPLDSKLSDWRYKVVLEQEVPHRMVGCRIEVLIEKEIWTSFEVAATPEKALVRGLLRLRPTPDVNQFSPIPKFQGVLLSEAV